MDLYSKVATLQKLGVPYTHKGITYSNTGTSTLKSGDRQVTVTKTEKGLKKVNILYGTQKIDKTAFMASYVHEVTLPKTLTEIGDNAFNGCICLEKVNLEGVKHIGEQAFIYTGLREITLADADIGMGAFSNTYHLKKVTLKGGNTLDQFAFVDSAIHSIDLSNVLNVTIPSYAFMGNKNLSHVTIPSHSSSVHVYSFAECRNLKSVMFENNSVYVWGHAFDNCVKLVDVNLDKVTYICLYAFQNCAIEEADLSNCTGIESYAFKRCINLHTVKLPKSLQGVSVEAFDKCYHIERIYVPHDLDSAGVQKLLTMFPTKPSGRPKYIVSALGSTSKYIGETLGDTYWEVELQP